MFWNSWRLYLLSLLYIKNSLTKGIFLQLTRQSSGRTALWRAGIWIYCRVGNIFSVHCFKWVGGEDERTLEDKPCESCCAAVRTWGGWDLLGIQAPSHAEMSRSTVLPGLLAVQGPSSFWPGFGAWACGESNFRKSVLPLPPSLSFRRFCSSHRVSDESLPSFLLCSVSSCWDFFFFLPAYLFLLKIFSIG